MKWEEYLVPTSLEEALAILKERQGQARVVAGGTDLIIQLKKKEVTARCLVDISNLDELKGIELEDGFIRIGACVTHQELASSSLLRERATALAEGASQVGSPQIRNMGTVGGNIVNAQPAADTVVPLMALVAEVEVATFKTQSSKLKIQSQPLERICLGPGQCTVDPTAEILTAVRLRALGPNQGSAFERLAKRKALSLPILNAAAVVTLNDGGDTFQEVRLAVGPVAPTPFRARQAEEALRGAAIEAHTIAAALELAAQEAQPRTNPMRGSEAYRREMVKVLLRRAIERAVKEAQSSKLKVQSSMSDQGIRGSGNQGMSDFLIPDFLTLTMTLNGEEVTVQVQPSAMLVEVLRDQLELMGTKVACGEGECGACTVLLDGKAVASCLVPALKVQGREVMTVEGLAPLGELHPLQKAFVEHGAVQCGYCTPGMLMSAKALLNHNPHPTEDEIRLAISGNLCRCTGYAKIVEAILEASAG